MIGLELIASLVLLTNILIGPLTYLTARLNFPPFIVYILSIVSILIGILFALIGLPIWYMGLIPIYFGYISIKCIRQKKTHA